MAEGRIRAARLPRWLGYCLLLGLYLTLRGYHSLDGDQAYRLPLLLHRLDPTIYADDPFVRAFDRFNPHRGSLMILGGAAQILGLSPTLFLFFCLTFVVTCRGIDALARATWPNSAPCVSWVAVTLFLIAKAGNVGTNHLFEAMVLDRLMTLALGWLALALLVDAPTRGRLLAAGLCALATLIHPSLGLQLAFLIMGSWVIWAVIRDWTQVSTGQAVCGCLTTGLAIVPGLALNLTQGHMLTEGLAADEFWHLAVELQGPQHMLPHLWRTPQWLGFGCYFVLAAMAIGEIPQLGRSQQQNSSRNDFGWPAARVRLALMLAVVLLWLAASWCAIEIVHQLRITLFQPFRLATVARGLALVLIAGRVTELLLRGDWLARLRAILLVVAFAGDWMLVVVTVSEVLTSTVASIVSRHARVAFFLAIAWGLCFLCRHDTESGHWPIILALGAGLASHLIRQRGWPWLRRLTIRRGFPAFGICACLAMSWLLPALSLLAGMLPAGHSLSRLPLMERLVARSRFTMVPVDDIERLAVWCRDNTPAKARFIGPPGPKTFRLWSRRSLAFCRAGSPYDAASLADWFARFQDHVDLHLTASAFVKRYIGARHEVEARYDGLSDQQKAALALRQGADYVIAPVAAAAGRTEHRQDSAASPLQLLHREGRYAVYRVWSELLSQDHRQR